MAASRLSQRARILLGVGLLAAGALVAATVVALVDGYRRGRPARLVAALGAFSGVDLLRLERARRSQVTALLAELDAIAPPTSSVVEDRRALGDKRWFVWRFPMGDDPGLVVFEGLPSPMSPGESSACFTVYDSNARLLSSSQWFSVGSKIFLEGARLLGPAESAFPCIEVHCPPGGVNPARQHYALFGDAMDLVHVAGEAGSTQRDFGPRRVGPGNARVEARTAEDWERSLFSSNPAEVLRTLLWLGLWRDPRAGDSALEALVRDRPGVAARLAALEASPDAWTRESAVLASHPKRLGD